MWNASNKNLIKSASYFSFVVSCVILIIKSYGYLITNSNSMLASLIDTMLDISSSLLNLVAIQFAIQPPDYKHRFGHEKIQDLAVFSQSIFFFISGALSFVSSVKSLTTASTISNPELGYGVMYACILLLGLLISYQTYVVMKTKSEIIKLDKTHYFVDFITNIAVIISIYLTHYFWFADGIFGILISTYIIKTSYSFFTKAIKNLIDQEFDEPTKAKILSILSNYSAVSGVHDMKTRYAANKPFIQFHLELDGKISLYEAHEITDRIYNELLEEFPDGDIIIHQDPFGIEETVLYREQLK